MGSPKVNAARNPALVFSMAGLAAAFWLIGRPYAGLYHDARLYALQALARLHPESLGQDVFLRFGSQDSFTVSSPLYASLIDLIGLEDAARLLTIAGHIWWLAAYFVVARMVLSPRESWLAIALVAALPGHYGAWNVFRYAEPFFTPRLLAEAAVLTSIALALHHRRLAAAAFSMIAILLHPLMGTGGALIAASLLMPIGLAWLVPALVLGGLGITCIIALTVPFHPVTIFDPEWLELIRSRSQFLLIQDWNSRSWEGAMTSLAALWIFGSAWPRGQGRRLFMTAIMVGLLGVIVTVIGASTFKVVLLTQGQAWRWTWIAATLVAIASIKGLPAAWAGGPLHRAAILSLFSGWLLIELPAVSLIVVACILWSLRSVVESRHAIRTLELTGSAMAIAALYLWVINLPSFGDIDPDESLGRSLLQWIKLAFTDGFIPAVIAAAAWWAVQHSALYARALVATFSLSIAGFAFAATAPDFFRNDYVPHDRDVLSDWQQRIPLNAEVFWPENTTATWFLLHRRHYVSADQGAGILFSERAAIEILRRSRAAGAILPPTLVFGASIVGAAWPVTSSSLTMTCQKAEIDFVVTRQRLEAPTAASPMTVEDRVTSERHPAYLYDCNTFRQGDALQAPSR